MPPTEPREREIEFKVFEIKELDEQRGTFSGVASVMGIEDLGGDMIDEGAFDKTISENPIVPVLYQHRSGEVIGAGEVSISGKKVTIKGQLDMDDPQAILVLGKLKKKLIKGLSVGFQTLRATWEELKDRSIRHIKELRLWEVSIVTFPMLPEAQVASAKAATSEIQDQAAGAGGTPTPAVPVEAAPAELPPRLMARVDDMRAAIGVRLNR